MDVDLDVFGRLNFLEIVDHLGNIGCNRTEGIVLGRERARVALMVLKLRPCRKRMLPLRDERDGSLVQRQRIGVSFPIPE